LNLGVRLFLRGFAVEEEDVRLHSLRVEDADGQAQEGVNVGLAEPWDRRLVAVDDQRFLGRSAQLVD
jgi:hypothetical protein